MPVHLYFSTCIYIYIFTYLHICFYHIETEKVWLGLTASKSDNFEDDEVQIHLILIGHTGVGKTSLRKHLRNERINMDESPTIVMEPEFLYRELMELQGSTPFKQIKDSLDSGASKVFLTMWDTGGQPIFQDLLPCFARLKCMYGIVFRLPDIETFDSYPTIRPCDEYHKEALSPFTNEDIVYRNLAYVQAYSCSLKKRFEDLPFHENFGMTSFDTNFPAAVVVGTCKDEQSTSRPVDKSLEAKKNELNRNISDFIRINNVSVYPVPHSDSSYIHEIDNTASGLKADLGIDHLRNNLTQCAQESNTKISREWKLFKAQLQRVCYSDSRYVNIGIMPLSEAVEIGKSCNIFNPKSALKYFHELGVFMWYHLSKRVSMNSFVVIDPKTLLEVLSKVFCFNPSVLTPEQESLVKIGIVTSKFFGVLLKNKACKIDDTWFIAFLEEHHLAVKVLYSEMGICYFLPSLLSTADYKDKVDSFDSDISPLYIVPESGYIATGMFTRLLTALAGVTYGSTIWRIPLADGKLGDVCRNQFEFIVNGSIHVVLSEYSHFIRVDCIHYSGDFDEDVFSHIASTLDVQLQRIVPRWVEEREFAITFECDNELCKSSTHFFIDKNILLQSGSKVKCFNQRSSLLKPSHIKWRSREVSKGSGKAIT